MTSSEYWTVAAVLTAVTLPFIVENLQMASGKNQPKAERITGWIFTGGTLVALALWPALLLALGILIIYMFVLPSKAGA